MMSYGILKHSSKARQRASSSPSVRQMRVVITVNRGYKNYGAAACVLRKKGYGVKRCGHGYAAKSPTAAVKKALHKLASLIR